MCKVGSKAIHMRDDIFRACSASAEGDVDWTEAFRASTLWLPAATWTLGHEKARQHAITHAKVTDGRLCLNWGEHNVRVPLSDLYVHHVQTQRGFGTPTRDTVRLACDHFHIDTPAEESAAILQLVEMHGIRVA